MSVFWHCGKCGSVFRGSWMTERCDCGNSRMMTYAEAYGGQAAPVHVIRPIAELDGVLFLYAERKLASLVTSGV